MTFCNALLRQLAALGRLAFLLPFALTAAPLPSGLQFGQAQVSVSEASKVARIPVVRTGSLVGSVSAAVNTSDGTATSGQDYLGTNVTITLPSGVGASAVLISLVSDTIHEPAETVNLQLAGTNVGPRSVAVLRIIDNDPAGVINFASPSIKVSETGRVALVKLVRTNGTASDVSVRFSTEPESAVEGDDYVGVVTNVIFGANERDKSVEFPIVDDDAAEGHETLRVRLTEPTEGAVLGTVSNAIVTILDNEPAFWFSRPAYFVNESAPADCRTNFYPIPGGWGRTILCSRSAVVTVLRSGSLDRDASVQFVTGSGSACNYCDYQPVNRLLSFPKGVAARFVAVHYYNNYTEDGDRTVDLILTNAVGAPLGVVSNAVLTIVDDDEAGVVQFAAQEYSAFEASGKVVLPLRRTGGTAHAYVRLEATGCTATPGEDFEALSTVVHFGFRQMIQYVTIPIVNDGISEGEERALLSLVDPTAGTELGTNATATLTIYDPPQP